MPKELAHYINGNHTVQIFSDGTKRKVSLSKKAKYFTYDRPENFDIHISNRCNGGCSYCHENSTVNGELPKLDKMLSSKWYNSIKPGQEMAIGGGNVFESPDLIDLLKANKKKGIISNLTVNQVHVAPNFKELKEWVDKELVYGIGISLVDSKSMPWDMIDALGDNVVIHTINGILSKDDLKYLRHRKVLILGYKDLRRGHNLLETSFSKEIKDRQTWLSDNLKVITNKFKLCSFDCLSIEQLNPKSKLDISDKDWMELYQGSDIDVTDNKGHITCSTMYIDLCDNGKVARMSTAALDKRYDIDWENDSIMDLFRKSTQGW